MLAALPPPYAFGRVTRVDSIMQISGWLHPHLQNVVLVSRICPSEQNLSSRILTACIHPALLRRRRWWRWRRAAGPGRRVTFSFTALPSCKWLCWQDCDGCNPPGPWQTGSRPALSLSTTTHYYRNFSLICQMGFLSQSATVKLVTVTCGRGGAQSPRVWFSVSASACPGVIYDWMCAPILFLLSLLFFFMKGGARHTSLRGRTGRLSYDAASELSSIAKYHACRNAAAESWGSAVTSGHPPRTRAANGRKNRWRSAGERGREGERKRERQMAAACHPQLTQEAW